MPKTKGNKSDYIDRITSNEDSFPFVKDIDIKTMKVTANEINFGSKDDPKRQGVAWPKLNDDFFVVKTGPIKLSERGIPGEKFYSDAERKFIQIPIVPGDEEGEALGRFFKGLDKYTVKNQMDILKFPENKKKLAKAYTYSPTVKKPKTVEDPLDDEPKDEKKKKSPYVKAKFGLDKDENIITEVKLRREEPYTDKKGRERKKVVYTNVTNGDIREVHKHIRWNSEVRFTLHVFKLWASKSPNKDGVREFSYGIKVIRAVVDTKDRHESVNDRLTRAGYDESDDCDVYEEDESGKQVCVSGEDVAPSTTKSSSSRAQSTPADDSDQDSDQDSDEGDETNDENENENDLDSDAEPEPVAKSKKKSAKKAAPVEVDSDQDSEQDSDDEPEPVAKSKKKSAKKAEPVEEDSDKDSDDEEPAPKAKAKGRGRKAKAEPVEADSDQDSDDEEPAPKPKAKTKAKKDTKAKGRGKSKAK